MPTFQIDAVEPGFRSWSPADKPNLVFNYYTVTFAGEQGKGEADLRRTANEPAPTVGEVLEGYEIAQKPGKRPELKPERSASASSAASASKSTDFRSPEQLMMGDAIGKVLHRGDERVALLAYLNPEDREREAKKLAAVTPEQFALTANWLYQLIKNAP